MIVSEHELGLILNPRIRQRTFRLPVRYGKWGERRPCPARLGSVYRLRAPVPYDRLREEARHQPTCGARVLWLIDQCELPAPSVLITVQSVDQEMVVEGNIIQGYEWLVRFTKGDQSDILDKPRLLAAKPGLPDGDYTTVPSRSLSGAAEEVSGRLQGKYAESAWEARSDGLMDQRERLLAAVGWCRLEATKLNAGSAVARKRLKSVEHQLRAYDREARRSA